MQNLKLAYLFVPLMTLLPACAVSSQGAVDSEATGQTTEALTDRWTPRLAELGSPALADLERLYASGTTAGGLPEGRAVGRAFFLGLPGITQLEEQLHNAGWPTSRSAEDFLANVIWRGKTFHAVSGDADRIGTLTNDVLGLDIATADIKHITQSDDPDEADTFYLDYSGSSLFLVRGVQDYIRAIAPGLYIGKAFLKLPGGGDSRVLACYFALDFTH